MAIERNARTAARARRSAARHSAAADATDQASPRHSPNPDRPSPDQPGPDQPGPGQPGPDPRLGEALSEQELQARQLHEELVRLRQTLSTPLAGATPLARAPSRRPAERTRARARGPADVLRRRLILLALLVALALLLTLLTQPWQGSGTGAIPQPGTAVAADQPASAADLLALGLPARGPGSDAPGVAFSAVVLGGATVEVTERAVFSTPRRPRLDLVAIQATSLTTKSTGTDPQISNLRADVDGVRATPERTGPRSWVVDTPDGARSVLLRYQLTNAVALSRPSVDGRAFALVTPLLAGQALRESRTVVMNFPSAGVHNVVCADASPQELFCAKPANDVWSGTVPAGLPSANVLLQVDAANEPGIS